MNTQTWKWTDEDGKSDLKMRHVMKRCRDGIYRNSLRPLTDGELAERFWRKAKIGTKDECWPWLASTSGSKSAYGQTLVNGRNRKAHAVAYELFHKTKIPKGMLACHTCDNHLCVNPHHIFIGTHKDNMQDMIRKGRGFVPAPMIGSRNPRAIINEETALKVKQFRIEGKARSQIAELTGLTISNVGAIVEGRSWRHVGDQKLTYPLALKSAVKAMCKTTDPAAMASQ